MAKLRSILQVCAFMLDPHLESESNLCCFAKESERRCEDREREAAVATTQCSTLKTQNASISAELQAAYTHIEQLKRISVRHDICRFLKIFSVSKSLVCL